MMKKVVVCAIALIVLVNIVSGNSAGANQTTRMYYTNAGCLGEPTRVDYWEPIVPTGNNCSVYHSSYTSPRVVYFSSDAECPTTPGSSWATKSYDTPSCNETGYSNPPMVTEQCTAYQAGKRDGQGAGDYSYFTSCINNPPTNPYVHIQVGVCESNTPTGIHAVPVEAGSAIFANTPNVCTPYYNTTDYSPTGEFATYVKTSAICDTNATTSLHIAFYNSSSCVHMIEEATLLVGLDNCSPYPGTDLSYVVTCLGTAPVIEPIPTAPTNAPHSGAVSSSVLSVALVAFLASLATLMM